MSTALTFRGRLPGVDCRPAIPPVEQPIRGDVAAFVGFAERGPVDTPVALVDPASFAAVFGSDYVVAEDAGRPVYAQLAASVRAFFDNGGIRCYAVRVTGPDRVSTRWAVPGLQIWHDGGAVSDVVVEAAWPGRWSADLQVSVEPIARPLATGVEYRREEGRGQLVLGRGPAQSVQPGDLVALAAGRHSPALYVRVAEVTDDGVLTDVEFAYTPAGEGSPPDAARPMPTTLDGLGPVLWVDTVTLLRMDLVVHRLVDTGRQLLERWSDLAYASFASVLQPPDTPQPLPDRSMTLRADAPSEAAAAAGLVVPASADPRPALVDGDDDLEVLDRWRIFVDERLGTHTGFSLLPDADALTSLAPDPIRLRGIHALLGVPDVAMVTCPDLTHRGWSPAGAPPVEPEPDPPPVSPPPDWSSFRCCDDAAPAVEPAPSAVVPTVTTPRVARVHLDPVAAYQEGPLRDVQQALVTLCAARADLVALLSVPLHYDTAAVLDWHRQLTSTSALADSVTAATAPLSYAAYWHPWLTIPEPTSPQLSPLRHVPPDGAVAGMIAARELERGIWVAPASVALRGPVGLHPKLTEVETVRLFDAHANVLRQRPGSFAPLSAHTLAGDALLQLSVRRLLIWLRAIALRAGQRYTFEVSTERFRQLVQRRFEAILADLTARGAWHAFRVVTDAGVTTSDDIENGRLVVSLQVAPTSPVEFLTVTLVRSGEGVLEVWEA